MPRNPLKHEDRWSPLLPAEDPAAGREYTVRARVWRYQGAGGWHFANLSTRQSAQIKSRFGATAKGWGSIRVRVRIGDTEWAMRGMLAARRTAVITDLRDRPVWGIAHAQ